MGFKKISRTCINCNQTFRPHSQKRSKAPAKYCSHKCYWAYRKEQYAERFWKTVQKTEGCWLWTGRFAPGGYGAFFYQRKQRRAHRVAFALTYGPIDADTVIRHTCDTPACVNPAHLLSGTHLDNLRDRDERGRKPFGSQISKILTDESVRQMRADYANGATQVQLAQKYNTHQSNVSLIIKRRTWTHVE